MKHGPGHKTMAFSANRRLVAASAAVGKESNTIHTLAEVDISEPRRLIREHRERTGESLSLTAYVVTCLARAVEDHRELNSFRRGRKLFLLDDITVNTLVERRLGGESVPEPYPVCAVQTKTYRDVHDEIRAAQQHESDRMGTLSKTPWLVRALPEFLARWFIRFAARSTTMAKRYGVVAVTAVGMFGAGATWGVPLTSATVTVTVGGIVPRPVLHDGAWESHDHLCLTISFNHDIVDGAPAARFMRRFAEILASGDLVREAAAPTPAS